MKTIAHNSPSFFVVLLVFVVQVLMGVTQVCSSSQASELKLAWDPVDNAYGYNLYYGLELNSYDFVIDVGPQPQYSVKLTDLEADTVYYFAVTAYNGYFESDFSNRVSFKTPADPTSMLGDPYIYPNLTTNGKRRAAPYTMPESGTITSITMYHEAGSGMMLVGIYADDEHREPGVRLGMSAETDVSSIAGWQTVDLISPVFVPGGTTIWLAWVYENNPGIRYQTATPGRAQSNGQWDAGMPDTFGPSTIDNYIYSIYATYIPVLATFEDMGNTEVFSNVTKGTKRPAMPYTMPEDGIIQNISMYHNGGSGQMLLGLYADDGQGKPGVLLGVSSETDVDSNEGWQTVDLDVPVFVSAGTPIWLSWVYENNPGIRYRPGSPGRAESNETWSGGMPSYYGSSSVSSYIYSIYATYMPIH